MVPIDDLAKVREVLERREHSLRENDQELVEQHERESDSSVFGYGPIRAAADGAAIAEGPTDINSASQGTFASTLWPVR